MRPPPPAPDPVALDAVPSALARRAGALPLGLHDGVLHVGVGPAHGAGHGADLLEELRVRAGAVAVTSEVLPDPGAALLVAYGRRDLGRTISAGDRADPVAALDAVLDLAVGLGASDVHLEATPEGLRVRLRRDGALHDAGLLPVAVREAVIARTKVRAGLDVAERRSAQDGRLAHPTPLGPVDVRVATLPVRHGERVTLRLLPRDGVAGLDRLGLPGHVVAGLAAAGDASDGLVVLCGPTGSGKTTTLHALLARLATGGRAVLTLEDPVERIVPGTTQTQVDPAAGLTFATGLRQLLRHDPDVLLVGEVRDAETAALTVEAATTGHLVLTTLHAVDAPSALDRLAELGVPADRAVPVLRTVVAQRLLALPCPDCAARGCPTCDDTGTRGRTAVAELLAWDAALRAAVLGAPDPAARRAALDAARRPRLRDVAAARAGDGRVAVDAARPPRPAPGARPRHVGTLA